MSEVKRTKTIEVTVISCDFCETTNEKAIVSHCAVCGKDCCDKHVGDAVEDGVICTDCHNKGIRFLSEDELIEMDEYGSVAAVDKAGHPVKLPHI